MLALSTNGKSKLNISHETTIVDLSVLEPPPDLWHFTSHANDGPCDFSVDVVGTLQNRIYGTGISFTCSTIVNFFGGMI